MNFYVKETKTVSFHVWCVVLLQKGIVHLLLVKKKEKILKWNTCQANKSQKNDTIFHIFDQNKDPRVPF